MHFHPLRLQMKPKDNKTDYTDCKLVCCVHTLTTCGVCELCQLNNVADLRKSQGKPVATPIANPELMQQIAMMQNVQMNQMMMQQQQSAS
jgi:hypothetical protein